MSSSAQNLLGLIIGAVLVFVGTAGYLGNGKAVHRLPVLTDAQQGLLLAGCGAGLHVWKLVSLL
jgi:hypothetical protein